MSIYISEMQYRGVMNYGRRYHHMTSEKSRIEKRLDWEDMLKEVSKLPPSQRREALRAMKRKARGL